LRTLWSKDLLHAKNPQTMKRTMHSSTGLELNTRLHQLTEKVCQSSQLSYVKETISHEIEIFFSLIPLHITYKDTSIAGHWAMPD
jgi:hypothetical protein